MKLDNIFGTKNRLLNTKDGSSIFICSMLLELLIQYLFIILLSMAKIEYESFTSAFYGTCIICLVNELGFLLAPVVYGKIKDTNMVKETGFKFNMSALEIIICILITFATIAFSAPLANYFVAFIQKTGFDMSNLASLEIKTVPELIVGLICVALIPAAVEEFLFRGVIARAFKSKNVVFAILMSAFLFAIMHGTPAQLVHQFFLGVICCIVYFMTKQIWAPIIIHFTNNAFALIGSFVLYKAGITEQNNHIINVMMIFLGAVALLGLIYALFKVLVKKNNITKVALNDQFRELILTNEEKLELQKYEEERGEQLKELDTQEKLEIFNQIEMETKNKDQHIQRRSLIYAIGFGMALWIIQTVMCYL